MRRIVNLLWLSLTCGVLIGSVGEARTAPPNVVLIMTDDQGYGDFSFTGNPYLKTPNIDRLASQSARFDRFFVSPVCAPTRASLLTGRYHLRCGVWGVTAGRETMRSEEVTLAEVLRQAGYRTAIFGKWHLGEHYPSTPLGQGFEEFYGFRIGHWSNYFDTSLEHNGEIIATRGYLADLFTDRAMEFIEKNRGRPFFCYLAYNTPHAPFQVPDRYFSRFKSTGLDDTLAAVYAMCANIDDNVGRLLARLNQLRLAENTIVIFLTDNGPNGDRYNGHMRGRKASVHEGGGRVPLLIRWPARLGAPRRIDQIAAHIDLFPTILELCGISVPAGVQLDGRSLAPLLKGDTAGWPERMLFTHQVRGRQQTAMFPGALRTQQYRLVNEGAGYQLYDMQVDPGQGTDIAAEKPELVRKLSNTYEDWYHDVTRQPLARPPIPVGYAQEDPVELPAPQADLKGGLVFKGKAGFAHDWITGWTSTAGKVEWEIDVVRPGDYEVSIGYLCPKRDAGSKIRVTVAGNSAEAVVRETEIIQLPSPDRVPRTEVYQMRWTTLPVGKFKLPKGQTRVTVEALARAGEQVMDLKYVLLKRLDSPHSRPENARMR